MKNIFLFILLNTSIVTLIYAQKADPGNQNLKDIHTLIDQYSQARETKDTVLLQNILAPDIDQLVSSGVWRKGINESIDGMMRSSGRNPGSRRIYIEKIRFIGLESGIVDARYEITNSDGSTRKMWSTFIVVYINESWKITAIRNMLPAK